MFENLKNCAVLFSGGLDSTLLLAMLIEENAEFTVFQFREGWTRAQRKRVDKLIKLWNLKVFSYAPMNTVLVGQDDNLAIVYEYAGMPPLVRDVVEGDNCLLKHFQEQRMFYVPMQFDTVLVGSRQDDTHWTMGKAIPAERWEFQGREFWAPFYGRSRDWVKQELRARGLDDTEATDEEDTGSWSGCAKCLHHQPTICPLTNNFIPPVSYDERANLTSFREAYGITA